MNENPWHELQIAEPGTRPRETHSEATAVTPSTAPLANLPGQGNTWSAIGIGEALARRSRVNAAKAVLKQFFIFPEEQLRPMSYQIPASYGQPTSIYPGVLHGVPYESLHFESAPNVKRATVKVTGYDD